MLWFLIRILLLVILCLLIKRCWHALTRAVQTEGGLPPRPEHSSQPLVRDPECGLHLAKDDALTVQRAQGTLYFCSRECRDAYLDRLHRSQS